MWPLSKKGVSKSFLKLKSRKTIIEEIVRRFRGVTGEENVLFVVDKAQAGVLRVTFKHLPARNVIVEPFGRNTASAVGLAAVKAAPDDILVIMPTDALIEDGKKFRQAVTRAVDFVQGCEGKIVCIGVEPTEAATAYGYIKILRPLGHGIYCVDKFVEKPSPAMARKFVSEKRYLWNAGIFVARAKDILAAMKKHAPKLYKKLDIIRRHPSRTAKAYAAMKNRSIDYQLLEKMDDLYCVRADFKWIDIGNWVSMAGLYGKSSSGNAKFGDVHFIDTSDSFVYNSGTTPIGVLGMDNVVIVRTNNGVLVCGKEYAQRVRDLELI